MAEINLDLERERARARKALADERNQATSQEIESRRAPPASGPILKDKNGRTAQTQAEVPSAEEQFRLEHPEIANPIDAVTAIPKGIYNAGAETVGTGLDIADAILGTQMGTAFRKSPVGPALHTGRKDSDFVMDAAQTTTGMLAGGKIMKSGIGKLGGMSTTAKALRGAAVATGAELGSVLSMNKNTPRLFVNESDSAAIPDWVEDSWTPPIDPNSPDAVVRLKAAEDLFQEAILTGGAMGMAGIPLRTAWGYGLGIFRNIKNAGNKDKLSAGFAKDLYEIGAGITPDMTREEKNMAIEKFLSAMKKNEDEIIKLGDTELPDVELKQDTIDKMISLLDPRNPDDVEKINVLEGLRSAALQGRNAPKLETTLTAPGRALDDTVEGLQTTRGGDQSILKTLDITVDDALGRVKPFKDKVTSANADLVLANRGLNKTMKDHNAFSDVMDRTTGNGGDVNVFTTKPVTKIADDITKKVHGVDDALTARKNELYAKIGDGEVDQEAVIAAAENAGDALTPELRLGLTDAGTRFKDIGEWARTSLEDQIQTYRLQGQFSKVDKLRKLKTAITDDQLDYIAANNPQMKVAAEEAKKFFKEEYVPKFREGVGPDLQGNRRTMPKLDAQVENRVAIENTLKDNSRPEYTDKIIDIIATSTKDAKGNVSPGNADLAYQYGMANIAKKFQDEINTTGVVSPDVIKRLGAEVDRFQPILAKLRPEKQKEINDFLTMIRDKDFNVKAVQEKLTGFQRDLADAEDQYLGSYMKGFFAKNKDGIKGWTAVDDTEKALETVMSDTNRATQLTNIKLTAANDPIAQRGLEAAWGKTLAKHFAGNTVSTADIPDGLLKSGSIIFEDQPELLSGIKLIVQKAQAGERANTLRQGGGLNASAADEARNIGINTAITWIWGVLNPTAAKIRTMTREAAKKNAAKPKAQQAIDLLLADKEDFLKIARRSFAADKKKLTLREKTALFRGMVKAGIYEPEDIKEVVGSGDVGEQTEQALPKPK